MAKGLLISFAGYPYTPSSLMPDNGLASLAAVLLKEGNEVTILDYGTVDIMERLFPHDLSRRAGWIYDLAGENGSGGPLKRAAAFLALKQVHWQLEKH